MKTLPTAAIAAVMALTGCSTPPPIALYRLSRACDLAADQQSMVDAVRDYGCEVEDISYGAPEGLLIPIKVTGRHKTRAEIYRERAERAESMLERTSGKEKQQ